MDRVSFQPKTPSPKKESFSKKYILLIKKAFLNAPTKERFGIAVVASIGVFAFLTFLQYLATPLLVRVPEFGGTYTEGVVGSPRFVNPVLAYSQADLDVTRLVYRGLMQKTLEGTLVTDIAKEYTVSSDGTEYTFLLRDDIRFHDGTPLTAEDVRFTIDRIQEPVIKSPESVRWEGVTTTILDPHTVQFSLSQPLASFLQNATIGILPKHIWEKEPVEAFGLSPYNLDPIGAGPFRVVRYSQRRDDQVLSYTLRSFADYQDAVRPYIRTYRLKFYDDETSLGRALSRGTIDGAGFIKTSVVELFDNKNGYTHVGSSLARIFGIFFNTTHPLLKDPAVRQAINLSIDRQAIIDTTYQGRAVAIATPFPPTLLPGISQTPPTFSYTAQDTARALLQKAGWELNSRGIFEKAGTLLSFEITTGDSPELISTATLIADTLTGAGIHTTVRPVSIEALQEDTLRGRTFSLLFFGQIITSPTDLYAFWHSSQRNDPGLNITGYAQPAVDALLEKMIRSTTDSERLTIATSLQSLFEKNPPAVFLFVPEYTYIHKTGSHLTIPEALTSADDRFTTSALWHLREDLLIPLFTR